MNEMALYFSGVISMFLLSSWMKKKNPVQVLECTGDINFDELTERIEALSDLKEQLYDVENMITEIEASEQGERGIALNLTMPTADTKYNFLVNNQSEAVLELLYAERRKLRSSIVENLSKIRIRSNENVTQTIIKREKTINGGEA